MPKINVYKCISERNCLVWLGLIFNDISAFVGYLIAKSFLSKDISDTIKHEVGRTKGFILFPKGNNRATENRTNVLRFRNPAR